LVAKSDYTLNHTVAPGSSYLLIHKPGFLIFDGNFNVSTYKNFAFSLWSKAELTHGEEGNKLPTSLKVRVNHDTNRHFSVGLEKVDLLNGAVPDVVSAHAFQGFDLSDGWRAYVGPYLAYSFGSHALNKHRYIAGFKHKKFSGWFEGGSTRVEVEVPSKEDPQVKIKETKWNKDVGFRFDANPDNKTKVGGDVIYNPSEKQDLKLKLWSEYKVDNNTSVKAKIENDNSVAVGLTHNYGGFVNLGFVSTVKICLIYSLISQKMKKSLMIKNAAIGMLKQNSDYLLNSMILSKDTKIYLNSNSII
jgi:hypothetical protein